MRALRAGVVKRKKSKDEERMTSEESKTSAKKLNVKEKARLVEEGEKSRM